MRILAINYEYPPLGGGGGVVFQNLYDELGKRHEIVVLTTHYAGLPRRETRSGQEIHRVPVLRRTDLATASMPSLLSFPPTSWWCGRRLLRSSRFDVINTHFVVPTAPSAQLLSSRFGVPNVLSLHGGDLYDPSKRLSPHRLPVLPTIIRSLLKRADRVVAQSSNTAENARRIYGVARPIDIIPLGIVPPGPIRASRAELGIGDERWVMITIGRLIARKGLADLVQVVHDLRDPADLLVVIGEGPDLEALERQARELEMTERIRFTGRVGEEEKWKYLSVADAYVSTSLHEGFGLVFLEGMHCGLPVICYDHGGQTDFLRHGRTGLLVPLSDLEAFVQSVRRLKTERELAAACSRFNREHVQQFYIDRYAERHEELFEETLRRPPRAQGEPSA